MSDTKSYARIDRLYHVMVELLHAPKTIDVMRKMPCEVKNGEVLDFNGRSFGDTDKPDGYIFGGEKEFNRVTTTQAVTFALKRDYTKALKEWLGVEDVEEEAETDKAPKANAKRPKPKPTKEPAEEEFELLDEISELLEDGKLKKAKKLLALHEDHDDYKKAKKLVKKASK